MENEFFGMTRSEIFDFILESGSQLIIGLIILFVGFKASSFAAKTITKILSKRNTDKGLITFLGSLVKVSIKILTIITVLNQIGVEMTSFIALIGAAGLAIGMAFSGTLSNFAGGVMILFFKPFKIGDFIEAQGVSGIVKEIQIFHSILLTTDNKTIILPNGPLSNGNLTNFTTQATRRVNFTFSFAYGEDYDLAKSTIMDVINSHESVLSEPAPFIALSELGDSSVNLTVRVWVKKEDYWNVFFYINENVYKKFNETEGLSIPFPQMDIHIDKQ